MDVTPEELYDLFTLLRSSNPDENQSANNQLQELIKNPNTILALFTLLDDTKDETLRRHELFLLTNCFRNSKSQIDEDLFSESREQILQLLQNESNLQCIEAMVTVVQNLIDPIIPWPEIEQFAFSIDYNESPKNLFLTLSIFNGLIETFSRELILENQEGLMDLASCGLNADTQNQQIITQAVKFLYNIFISFQTKTPDQIPDDSIFQDILLEIFFHSIESSDINYFIHIISSIINGYKYNIFIFPVTQAMPNILQILQNDQLDTLFRLTVHDFFVISFLNTTYSNMLDKEDFDLIIEIENYITDLIVSSSEETKSSTWFDDVIVGLSIFYVKMDPDEAVSFTMEQSQNLLSDVDMNDPNSTSAVCFSLLLFFSCIVHYQDNINEDQMDIMYQTFLDAINSHIDILMCLSGDYLNELFQNFKDIVNSKYVLPTFNSLLTYLAETKDDLILVNFVGILDNSDPIFDNLMETSLELINNGSLHVQCHAYCVISLCIEHSNLAAYEIFDSLYEHFAEIIKNQQLIVQMPHSLSLLCLSSLINLSPEEIESSMNEFLLPILTVFHNSKDQILIQYILTVLDTISNYKNLTKALDPQYYELMVTDFPRLIQKDWKTKIEEKSYVDFNQQKIIQKFINASLALEILAKFTVEYKVYAVECTIMNYLPEFIQALKLVSDQINSSKRILNTLVLIIGNANFSERGDKKEQIESELQQLKEQIQLNSTQDLIDMFEEKKLIIESYYQEIEICKSLSSDIIELLDTVKEENFASYLLLVLKVLIVNYCIDEDQFENIINLTLRVISNLNDSSICIFHFAHVIYEISRRIDFDSVCDLVMPFVKDMLLVEDNPKSTINALTFIKSLDDFSFEFLQRSEMSDFWDSIPDLISDPSNNKGITSAVVKMMSTVCQNPNRDQIVPLSTPLLDAAKKRLIDEIDQPSELRDNLAGFLAVLGGSVIGDYFPFNEIIPLILSVIPLHSDFTLCSDLYQFISGIYSIIIVKDDQMKNLYVSGLIELFSLPYKKIKLMNINIYVLKSLQKSLMDALRIDENEDDEKFMDSILDILDGDQEKFSMFAQTFDKIQYLYMINNEFENM